MKLMTRILCTSALGCAGLMMCTHANAQDSSMGSGGSGSSSKKMGKMDMSATADADKSFLTMAAQSDKNEIALSQLASTKASNAKVKAFAQKMITDHQMLTTEMMPFAQKWGVTPPSGPDADHQAELDKLNGLSGMDFDKEYMTMMDTDHHKALDAFTSEESTTANAKFKKTVMKGRKVVAMHTTMADKAVKMMS